MTDCAGNNHRFHGIAPHAKVTSLPWRDEKGVSFSYPCRSAPPACNEARPDPRIAVQVALLGGQVRVRLEDNLYMERGVPAPSNASLGEKGIDILRTLGKEPATTQEAREMPGLTKLVEASSQQQDEQSANDKDGSQKLMGSDLFFKKENRGQEGE